MDKEQMYRFIDKSGHCFEDFQIEKSCPTSESEDSYRDMVGAMLRASNNGEHDFSVGDMFCFRDELVTAGFVLNTDFYMKKV